MYFPLYTEWHACTYTEGLYTWHLSQYRSLHCFRALGYTLITMVNLNSASTLKAVRRVPSVYCEWIHWCVECVQWHANTQRYRSADCRWYQLVLCISEHTGFSLHEHNTQLFTISPNIGQWWSMTSLLGSKNVILPLNTMKLSFKGLPLQHRMRRKAIS
jgi:hypothetical protein